MNRIDRARRIEIVSASQPYKVEHGRCIRATSQRYKAQGSRRHFRQSTALIFLFDALALRTGLLTWRLTVELSGAHARV